MGTVCPDSGEKADSPMCLVVGYCKQITATGEGCGHCGVQRIRMRMRSLQKGRWSDVKPTSVRCSPEQERDNILEGICYFPASSSSCPSPPPVFCAETVIGARRVPGEVSVARGLGLPFSAPIATARSPGYHLPHNKRLFSISLLHHDGHSRDEWLEP